MDRAKLQELRLHEPGQVPRIGVPGATTAPSPPSAAFPACGLDDRSAQLLKTEHSAQWSLDGADQGTIAGITCSNQIGLSWLPKEILRIPLGTHKRDLSTSWRRNRPGTVRSTRNGAGGPTGAGMLVLVIGGLLVRRKRAG